MMLARGDGKLAGGKSTVDITRSYVRRAESKFQPKLDLDVVQVYCGLERRPVKEESMEKDRCSLFVRSFVLIHIESADHAFFFRAAEIIIYARLLLFQPIGTCWFDSERQKVGSDTGFGGLSHLQ